jgi:hypothetical protein
LSVPRDRLGAPVSNFHKHNRAQTGVDFLPIADQLRVCPPHGFIACGGHSRHLVESTGTLRAEMASLYW